MSKPISLLGVHCSISGGYLQAVSEAERLKIDTFQIFTKNQRQWREKVVSPEEATLFKNYTQLAKIKTVISHTSYLINLGSTDENIRSNSILALAGELIRCHALGIPFTVLHPGAGKGIPEEKTIDLIAEGLRMVLNHTHEHPSGILLENTAGQGTSLGYKFSHHAEIIKKVNSPRLGVCLDTCHAFVAGFDIRTEKGIETLFHEIEKHVGISRLKAIHLNDSKGELGSKLDRHAHIGKGQLGLVPFKYILKNFPDIPKILELDKEDDMDAKNLKLLRELQ